MNNSRQTGENATIKGSVFFQGVLIYILALIIRCLKIIVSPILLRDSAYYLTIAEKWNVTNDYSSITPEGTLFSPLPVYIIKITIQTGFPLEVCGRFWSMFLGTCIPVIGLIITNKIFKKKKLSVVVGLLLAFNPLLIEYSTQPLRESYYLLCVALLINFLFDAWKNGKKRDWCICGLCCAIGFFCRYEILEFMVIGMIALLGQRYVQKRERKVVCVNACVFVVSFVLTLLILLSTIDYDLTIFVDAFRMKNG